MKALLLICVPRTFLKEAELRKSQSKNLKIQFIFLNTNLNRPKKMLNKAIFIFFSLYKTAMLCRRRKVIKLLPLSVLYSFYHGYIRVSNSNLLRLVLLGGRENVRHVLN